MRVYVKVQVYWSMLWGTTKLPMMLGVTNTVLFAQELPEMIPSNACDSPISDLQ